MDPRVTMICSALERAAALIEKGMGPAKALRQASSELQEHCSLHANERIPEKPFDLGTRPS